MIEEEAVVAAVEGRQVWVEKARKSACGSCDNPCASSVIADFVDKGRIRLAVTSLIVVQPGDRVVVGIPENAILVGALGVYLFPLSGLLVGAILGKAAAASLAFVATDLAALSGALIGLAGTLVFLKFTPVFSRNAPQAVVLRKLG